MPDPANFASEDAFMAECVPMMEGEGHDHDQAIAACSSMWEQDKSASTVDRAWSVLTVKSIDVEQRTIEGIASTPTVDRMGDIVEPMGAKFTLPLPLLHHHDHKSPVGHVVSAKATRDGITIKAKLAQIAEPGPVKDRVDTAWAEIKAGLVRGLSIGFKPMEYEALKEGGLRFLSWNWFELSLVTIPAQADAQISLIKSLDVGFQAEHGQPGTDVIRASGASKDARKSPLKPEQPGTSISLKPKGSQMSKTVTEQISALEAKCAANQSSMEAIMTKTIEEDRSTDDGEKNEFDDLERENEKLAGDLKRLRSLEKTMQASAKPVDQVKSVDDASTARNGGYVRVSAPKLAPGIAFARVVKCLAMAEGSRMEAVHIAETAYGDDQRIANVLKAAVRQGGVSSEWVTKAAVEAGTTGTWGNFLVGDEGTVFADFAEYLRPMTILGKFGQGGVPALRQVPFRTPLLMQTGGGEGYWTGEGKGKGVTSFTGTRTTLTPLKAANIVVLTEELVRDSSPSAEAMVRDQMAQALAARIDTDFIDPGNAGTASIKPASITNGVTPTASSGASFEAVQADWAALMAPFIAADNPPMNAVVIMSATTALSLSLMYNDFGTQRFPSLSMAGGSFQGVPVIVSEYVGESGSPTGRFVWLVNASDIYLGDEGGVSVDMSREASLQMDSAPTNAAIETGSPSQSVPTTLVSLWQTDCVGFRAERTINWALRRTSAVSGLSSVQWGA